MPFDRDERRALIALARESIDAGLALRALGLFPQRSFSPALNEPRSAFVTLRIGGDLRGCCGSVAPSQALHQEVWRSAWASAFSDPRFAPLSRAEWPRTHVHLSILERAQLLDASSEQVLLQQLRPGIDGLTLELGAARATFLPAVWDQLPNPHEFLRHLKAKAGWSEDFWSPQIHAERYRAESFGEESCL
jgi:AmmeMemoRadiSam system protein A